MIIVSGTVSLDPAKTAAFHEAPIPSRTAVTESSKNGPIRTLSTPT